MKKTVEIEQCHYLEGPKKGQYTITFVFKIGKKRYTYILRTHDFEMTEPITSTCRQESEETIIEIVKFIMEKKKRRFDKYIVRLNQYHSRRTRPSCSLSNYLYEYIISINTSEYIPQNFRCPIPTGTILLIKRPF